jgi:hypothetical protein
MAGPAEAPEVHSHPFPYANAHQPLPLSSRRLNDMVLENRVLELTKENAKLKTETRNLKRKFGVAEDDIFLSPEEIAACEQIEQVRLSTFYLRAGGQPRGIHGLPKLSLGPAMPYHFTNYGQPADVLLTPGYPMTKALGRGHPHFGVLIL